MNAPQQISPDHFAGSVAFRYPTTPSATTSSPASTPSSTPCGTSNRRSDIYCTYTVMRNEPFARNTRNPFQNLRPSPSTAKLWRGQPMHVEEHESRFREHGQHGPAPFTAREDVAVWRSLATFYISRPTRNLSTLSPEEELFWKQLRAQRSQHLREKRTRYGLRTLREAALHCPPPPRHSLDKHARKSAIILFPTL